MFVKSGCGRYRGLRWLQGRVESWFLILPGYRRTKHRVIRYSCREQGGRRGVPWGGDYLNRTIIILIVRYCCREQGVGGGRLS